MFPPQTRFSREELWQGIVLDMDSPYERYRFPRFVLSHGCDRFSRVLQRFVSSRLSWYTFEFPLMVTPVFTFAAGVQWFEAYQAAKERNVLIVGGLSAGGSIGVAGGWLAGGGHSALSPKYGLGYSNSPNLTKSHSRSFCRRGQRFGDNDCHCGR